MASVKRIDQSLEEFRQAIEMDQQVIVNKRSEWFIRNNFEKGICYLNPQSCKFFFHQKADQLVKITDVVLRQIDTLEKDQYSVTTHKKYSDYLNLAVAISEQFAKLHYKKVSQVDTNLTRRIIALQYRMGTPVMINPKEEILKDLLDKAQKWKKNEFVFKHKPHKQELSQIERERIIVACRYENFAKLIQNDQQLRILFFKWIIRDRLQAEIFIEMPHIQEKISASALAFRCGKKKALLWVNEGNRKDVLLKCVINEGKTKTLLSLLDENNKIAFADKYELSVKDIYRIMADKRKDIPGTLEMFEDGLHAWSVEEWGWIESADQVNPIYFNRERWWEGLPVYKTLTLEQAKNRFGPHMDGKNWSIVARASREEDAYTVKNVHGFMHVVIPYKSENALEPVYRIYPIGEFVEKFPRGAIIQFLHLFRTVTGKVHYLDQNVFYGQRQRFCFVVPATENEGKFLMADLKKDINEDIKFTYTGTHGTKISLLTRIWNIVKLLISFFWKQEQRSNLKRPSIPTRNSPTNCSEFVHVKLARSIHNFNVNLYETELSNLKAPKGFIWLFQARGHLKVFHPVHLTKQLQDGRLPRICQRTLPAQDK